MSHAASWSGKMLDLPAVIITVFTTGVLAALAVLAVIRSHGPARTLILSGVILEPNRPSGEGPTGRTTRPVRSSRLPTGERCWHPWR